MAHKINPVILCGGSGTRLWPLSTPKRPKQFLALTSEKSLIEDTAERFEASLVSSLSFTKSLVIGSEQHADLLEKLLPNSRKILEPFARNSAPAVAAASLSFEPSALVLILPADHNILDVAAFHEAIEIAAAAANDGAIVTFGVEPTHPATGYGYIKAVSSNMEGALQVETFVEKPDLQTAESYLTQGSYYWNAGIFLFRADTMLHALTRFAPDVLNGVKAAMKGMTDQYAFHLNSEAFANTPSISIDYAVMENASNVKTVPVSMGWSDVGGYRALHELLTNEPTENLTRGPVVVENSEGLYVRSEGPAVAVNGVSNLVIVATNDEVMITPMHADTAVKGLGAAVQSDRHALGLSSELRANARDWLWEAFDTWAKVGWDAERGGFVEQLHMDGTPDAEAPRRVRVQARQVFSFAKAIEMGWPDRSAAEALVEKGLTYIDTRLRHPEGGFVHVTAPDAATIEEKRDLYDHAFMILAGSTAYKATGNPLALKIAEDALTFLDAEMKCQEHGGWVESLPISTPRRANPHMHMLEAMMAYHDTTGCDKALVRAAECVRLFETRFFNPANDVMAEVFANDWSLETTENETVFEPGHHYEWATLLHEYERKTGHDTISWRRRLIKRADESGINPKTGFTYNAVQANGVAVNKRSRLWHQLERFRSMLTHTKSASQICVEAFANKIFSTYLSARPSGIWIDETENHNVVSDRVPSSMLYHLVTAIEILAHRSSIE